MATIHTHGVVFRSQWMDGGHAPGNTNGGKSLLLSIMKQSFSTLCGLLSILAITARESDPSGHTDYLARTQGLAMCVCHEPDCGSQVILPDRVKAMTSDSDHLSVREIYGTSRDIPITFKLFMACNTAPGFSTLDAAIMERVQYIPFNSTFGPPEDTPADETRQFRLRKFIARRDLSEEKQLDLAKRLMGMFFTAYVRHHMERPSYSLRPPRRIQLEARMQLQEVSIFRAWVGVFLRPCGMNLGGTLSVAMHQAATVMSRVICTAAEQWDEQEGHAQWVNTPWHRLPNRIGHHRETHKCPILLPKQIQEDVMTPGSPGWVRCQSVHLFRFVFNQTGHSIETAQQDVRGRSVMMCVVCPFVDTKVVVENFNKFRRQSRSVVNRPITNVHNTAPNHGTLQAERQEQQQKQQGNTDDTSTQPEQQPQQQQQDPQAATGKGNAFVGLSTRMKLDTGLVRNILQEVVGMEPFGDHYLGRALLAQNGVTVENHQPSSALIDDALARVGRQWFNRYRAPIAYPAMMTRDAIQEAMRVIALRPIRPVGEYRPPRSKEHPLYDGENDWDRMNAGGEVETDDEEFVDTEAVMYYPKGTPEETQSNDDTLLLTGRNVANSIVDRHQVRGRNDYRARVCLLFPYPRVPQSRLVYNPDDRHRSPMHSTNPTSAHGAESLLLTEAFWNATELQKEADTSRILAFDRGFSGIGEFKALRDYGQQSRAGLCIYFPSNSCFINGNIEEFPEWVQFGKGLPYPGADTPRR